MTEPGIMIDGHARSVRYLRLSVTDRCDLRCLYCRPAEGLPVMDRRDLLGADELILVGRAAASCGVRKIRLTGGEPLLRRDLEGIVAGLGAIPGIASLQLTTNGMRLAGLADRLAAAGLDGVNVSIDSLDPERFAAITRGGDLEACLAGIAAARAAGLNVKLNMVVMGGVNDHEMVPMVERFCGDSLAVRFIEYMPTAGPARAPGSQVSAEIMLAILGARFHLSPMPAEPLAGPALRYGIAGMPGRVGLIAPLSRHFCADCNRLRVTAEGRVRSCLFHAEDGDLRPWIAAQDVAGIAAELRRAVAEKPSGHDWAPEGNFVGDVLMSRTGG
ncbi:MAG: GTP 3',8-cyclase MoaA [Candidatus Krumholzibacteriia bacterium]